MEVANSDPNAALAAQYDPQPPDLAAHPLPAEVRELLETLAEQIHNQWARGRLDEGWRYGPVRHDERREHPCLIPYPALPEAEKAFDRATALSTLQGILAAGYRISR